jgi:hypothetical protein
MDNKFSTVFTSAHAVRVFLVSAKLKFSIACFGVNLLEVKEALWF